MLARFQKMGNEMREEILGEYYYVNKFYPKVFLALERVANKLESEINVVEIEPNYRGINIIVRRGNKYINFSIDEDGKMSSENISGHGFEHIYWPFDPETFRENAILHYSKKFSTELREYHKITSERLVRNIVSSFYRGDDYPKELLDRSFIYLDGNIIVIAGDVDYKVINLYLFFDDDRLHIFDRMYGFD